MKRFRSKNTFIRILWFMTVVLLMLPMNAVSSVSKVSIVIEHDPPDYFVPDHRMIIKAKVRDKTEINQVRCYFRADKQENYVFVPMEWMDEELYKGILPAPNKESQALEYLFVAVNRHGQAEKTRVFEISKREEKKVPVWQVTSKGSIQVGTDLSQIPEMSGFSDSIIVDIVRPSAGFDIVTGRNYTVPESETEGLNGAEMIIHDADTIPMTEELSPTVIASIAGGVAVVGGLVAVVVAAGGDDDEEMNIRPSNAQLSYTGGQELSVSGGEAPYNWTSSNPSVGNVFPGASTDTAIFNAFGSGSTKVMVADTRGDTASVTIDVADNVDIIFIRD
ncbi:hypothetical protein QUF72_12115 [Desulfobacterales bacterium HSG2]|nr:hypothetical protein [Desulfobacterales bacterium HSG2]